MFEVSINRVDIQEVEDRMDELTAWLLSHYVSIGACAIVLQAIFDKIDKLKENFDENEEEK